MSEQLPLDGKVILVTGAGGGIGRALAIQAAKAGASVVVNDLGASLDGKRESSEAAETVVAQIEKLGGKAVANGDSVAEPDGAKAMVTQATDSFGRLDAVINNAGILRDCFFHKMTYEDFDAVVKVHLYGAFNTSRAAADVFRQQESGSLIHMTSTSGLIGNLAQANYSAAKLGIASDAGADITGQIFAVRHNEIFLMSQPRPVRSVHSGDGWDIETVRDRAIPALRSSFQPLDVSGDIFCWDPV